MAKIMVEIDCYDEKCGACSFKEFQGESGYFCSVYKFFQPRHLDGTPRRLPECLAAEVKEG